MFLQFYSVFFVTEGRNDRIILLQVNISPSLHTNSSLDKSIKYGLVKDLFNTAGYLVPEPSGGAKTSLGKDRLFEVSQLVLNLFLVM